MRSGPCVLHSMGWIPLDEETRCGFCWIVSPGCHFFIFFSSSPPLFHHLNLFFFTIKCELESATSVFLLSVLPLCLIMLLSFYPSIYLAVTFLVVCELAIPLGRKGTLMFIKAFNVLCNYSGNTSFYYSLQ